MTCKDPTEEGGGYRGRFTPYDRGYLWVDNQELRKGESFVLLVLN